MEAVGDNPRSSSEAVAPRNRKGFSLVEAAIVLAVVGLVIGGIWYAASEVTGRSRATQFIRDLTLILDRAYISMKPFTISTYMSLNSTIISANWAPASWTLRSNFPDTNYLDFQGIPVSIGIQSNGLFVISIGKHSDPAMKAQLSKNDCIYIARVLRIMILAQPNKFNNVMDFQADGMPGIPPWWNGFTFTKPSPMCLNGSGINIGYAAYE